MEKAFGIGCAVLLFTLLGVQAYDKNVAYENYQKALKEVLICKSQALKPENCGPIPQWKEFNTGL